MGSRPHVRCRETAARDVLTARTDLTPNTSSITVLEVLFLRWPSGAALCGARARFHCEFPRPPARRARRPDRCPSRRLGLSGPGRLSCIRSGDPDETAWPCGVCSAYAPRAHFLASVPSLISRRRPRVTCSGGAGIVISSTPSLKFALAWSVIAPSGSGIVRQKLP